MSIPKVSVIVLHLDDREALSGCLVSLRRLTYPAFEVIVVHNGPGDPSLEVSPALPGGKAAEIVHTGGNLGFAAGNNIGISRALGRGADYVLLLNDDTVVAPDLLEKLVAEAEKDAPAGMFGARVFYSAVPERIWFSGASFNEGTCAFSFPGADRSELEYGHNAPAPSDYITGCAILVKRAVMEKVGMLDPRFFLYWEDSDWGLRARAAGYACIVVPSAKVWHQVSASGGGSDSPFKAYHKTFSHLLFCEIHAPRAKWGLLRGYLRDIAWLLFKSGGEKRFRKAWAYSLAIWDHFTRSAARPRPRYI